MSISEVNSKNIYYPPGGILMWIIIFLELFTFGIALIVLVANSKEDPNLYHQSRLDLNTAFGAINTVFLLTSGFFMATTVHKVRENKLKQASFFLKLTILGGLMFIILKGFEYYLKIKVGYTLGFNSFYTFYWLLTGFHVIHVIVGLVILFFFLKGFKQVNSKNTIEDIEAGATFWHMCDLIWLLLFPVLYLIL